MNNLPPGDFGIISQLINSIKLIPNNRLNHLEKLFIKHGDTFTFPMPQENFFFSRSSDFANQILLNPETFGKRSYSYNLLRKYGGNGLFVSHGEIWKKRRKYIQPFFNKMHLNEFIPDFIDITSSQTEKWKSSSSKEKNLSTLVSNIIGAITLKCVFGINNVDDYLEKYKIVDFFQKGIAKKLFFPIPDIIPTPSNLTFTKNFNKLNILLEEIIAERKQSDLDTGDLLGGLIEWNYDHPSEFSHDDILAELRNFIIASYSSTSDTICWGFHLLLNHQSVNQLLKKEIKNKTINTLIKDETYLDNVLYEIIRLYPVVPMIPRHVEKTIEIGEFILPAKSEIFLSLFHINRHPSFWQNPNDFQPSRFQFNDNKIKDLSEQNLISWGAGPRKCIGGYFSILESKVIMGHLSQVLNLELINKKPTLEYNLTFNPGPLLVREVN